MDDGAACDDPEDRRRDTGEGVEELDFGWGLVYNDLGIVSEPELYPRDYVVK